jgi:hypothetical protein
VANTWTSARGGSWSDDAANGTSPWNDGAGSNPNTGVPVAGDTVTVAAGHEVLVDVTIGAAGLVSLTLNSHASTIGGMIYWKDGTSGTIIIADAGHIQGSATSAVCKGRILANLSGKWTAASSTASTFANSQGGLTGAVTDGGGNKRIFTPTASPAWVVDALIGESMTINGVTYAIEDNDATTATLTTGPAIGATVTSWALVVRPLPADHTCLIQFLLTAHMATQYLDVALYSNEPTTKSVRTYGQIFDHCTCNTDDTFTFTGLAAAIPTGTLVRVSVDADHTMPVSTPQLAINTDYWVVSASGATVKLAATSGGAAIDVTTANGPINIHVGMYATWGVGGVNTLTKTTHGLANGTAVMLKWTGTAPVINGVAAVANTMYYVVGTASGSIQLAAYSGGTALTITGSPTTLDVYTGSTGAAPGIGGTNPYTTTMVNVLDDITGESTTWVPTASSTFAVTLGLSAVVLANEGPQNYDTQRLGLVAATAATMTLSAAVDSIQYPNARIWLMSRNVGIQSTCVTAVNIVDGTSNTSGGRFGEIRATAGQLTNATTFYGTGIFSGTSCTATTISGCTNGIYSGTSCTATTISGCINGIYTGTSHTATTISGCTYGICSGTSCTATTISGCTNGIYSGTSCTATTISGCTNGIYSGNGTFRNTIFSGNTYDIRRPRKVVGYGVSLLGGTQAYEYLHAAESITSQDCGATMYDLDTAPGGTSQPGYLGRWDVGGKTISTAYASGTHGTPPITPPTCVHVTTCQDIDVEHWVDIPVYGVKGQPVTVTIYAKQVTGTWGTSKATFELLDPGAASPVLDTHTVSAYDAWETLTLSTTALAADQQLWVRLRVQGGNAGGTGTATLYWFQVLEPAILPIAGDVLTVASGGSVAWFGYAGATIAPTATVSAEANTWYGTGAYGAGGTAKTPSKRASSIPVTNGAGATLSAADVKAGVVCDDVTGSAAGGGLLINPGLSGGLR